MVVEDVAILRIFRQVDHLAGVVGQVDKLLAVLAASASYIAVPAAMRISLPKANAGLYVPMSLAITFPFNIVLGIPLYFYILNQILS